MEHEEFPLSKAPLLVRDFVGAFQKYTEAPDEFLAIVPIYIASVIAGRWVEFNNQSLNNYYLIVGQTGTAKKTTAQALSLKLLREIKARLKHLQFSFNPTSDNDNPPEGPDSAYPEVTHFSIEGLQSHVIGNGASTAIQIGEYGTIFEVGKRQSQQNTISEITNMYDGNLISVKTVSRKLIAQNYAVSILGSSTESWLSEFCSSKNIGGGFVNRHLVVTGVPKRILPKPEQPPEGLWNYILSRFCKLIPNDISPQVDDGRIKWQGSKKKIGWSPEAEETWDAHYRNRTNEIRKLKSSLLVEVSARESTHAIKLAGLSAFLSERDLVSDRDLEFGIRMARWSTQNIISMVTSSDKQPSKEQERVLNKLRKTGPMSKTDLARALGGRQVEINRAISHMIIDEIVEDCPDGLLRVNKDVPNSQQQEIDNFFKKTNTCEFILNSELEIDLSEDSSSFREASR